MIVDKLVSKTMPVCEWFPQTEDGTSIGGNIIVPTCTLRKMTAQFGKTHFHLP